MWVFKQHQQNQIILPSFFLPAFEENAFNGQSSKFFPGEAELLLLFNLIKPLCFAWQKGKVQHSVSHTVQYTMGSLWRFVYKSADKDQTDKDSSLSTDKRNCQCVTTTCSHNSDFFLAVLGSFNGNKRQNQSSLSFVEGSSLISHPSGCTDKAICCPFIMASSLLLGTWKGFCRDSRSAHLQSPGNNLHAGGGSMRLACLHP